MTLLENIIKKALFERKQRLNEAINEWEYDGYLSPKYVRKVAGVAPSALKLFSVIAKGEKLPDELDQGIYTDIAKFLNFAAPSFEATAFFLVNATSLNNRGCI